MDGNTYGHECIAICQEVAVRSKGACVQAKGTRKSPSLTFGPMDQMYGDVTVDPCISACYLPAPASPCIVMWPSVGSSVHGAEQQTQ